ncbi:MAG: hypothetical protein ABSB10_03470 [Candidatus Bathyarchaeia archaeon]|jgi:hypothetical protein
MKIAILIVIVGLTLALVSGCATPYQPKGFRGGYTDTHIKDNIYFVEFSGNAYIDTTTAVKYMHRRAKELCQEKGFSDYRFMGERDTSTYMMVGSYGGGFAQASTLNKPGTAAYIECIK